MRYQKTLFPLIMALCVLMLAASVYALPNEPAQNQPSPLNSPTDASALNNPTQRGLASSTTDIVNANNAVTTAVPPVGTHTTTNAVGGTLENTPAGTNNLGGGANNTGGGATNGGGAANGGGATNGGGTTAHNTTISGGTTLSNTTNASDLDAENRNYIVGIIAIIVAAIIVIVLIIYAVSRRNHHDDTRSSKR